MSWHRKPHLQILAALAAGAVYGLVAIYAGWDTFTSRWIAPFGILFLNLLKLIAVPLIFSTLIVGVASLSDTRQLSRIGSRTLASFLALSLLAALLGTALALAVGPGAGVPEPMRTQLVASYGAGPPAGGADLGGPLDALVGLVPENLVAAASDNANLLQLIVIALLVGVVLLRIDAEKAAPVSRFLEGVAEIVIELVKLGMAVAPLGVFALIADALVSAAPDDPAQLGLLLSALGSYFLTLTVALALQTLVIFPAIIHFATRLRVADFFRGLAPAMLLAFSTSSSAATLPVTMEQCRDELRLPEEVHTFVLPLGATLHMNGTAMFLAVAAVFLAQAFGHPLSGGDVMAIVTISLVGSVGAVAIPSIGVVFLVVILETIGVPAAGVALVLAIDRLLDMMRTTTNVTGDAVVAAYVASAVGRAGVEADRP